jgi:hypothetical protein
MVDYMNDNDLFLNLALLDFSKCNNIEVYDISTFKLLGLHQIHKDDLERPIIRILIPEKALFRVVAEIPTALDMTTSIDIIEFKVDRIFWHEGKKSRRILKISEHDWIKYLKARAAILEF